MNNTITLNYADIGCVLAAFFLTLAFVCFLTKFYNIDRNRATSLFEWADTIFQALAAVSAVVSFAIAICS